LFGFRLQRVFNPELKMTDTRQLLNDYAKSGSDDAFRELVTRYLDLVYSAALRLVEGDVHRAEDVTQVVFVDLARKAASLPQNVMLGGWLHRHTCFVAANTMRGERRRQTRERQAVEMNAQEQTPDINFAALAPVLDAAINELEDADRAAIVLRFYEQQSFRSVGETLGSSEDAARMRVTRALEKLAPLLQQRGLTASAAALAVVLSAQAVHAAPAGLAVTVSAAVTASAVQTSTILATGKTIAMTTLQKTIVGAALAVAIGAGIYEAHEASALRGRLEALQNQQPQLAAAQDQVRQLQAERDAATNRVAALVGENAALRKNPATELKLRGEVGRLQQENTAMGQKSPLDMVAGSPETKKLIRDQQKMTLAMVYKDFAKNLKLSTEQSDKLNEVLADGVMNNIDRIGEILHDGKTGEQMNRIFAAQNDVLLGQIKDMLGPDGLAQYQDYTKNLAISLTTDQFSGMMMGDDAAKEAKKNQLAQAMREETQTALAKAGLPPDYQTVPSLNFANIASEVQGDQSIKLLEDIYAGVTARAGSFLSPDELAKFKDFTTLAVNNNRYALAMNRKLMAPVSK
jgi:RNA polymerase sigma factor (sigma-70 family)